MNRLNNGTVITSKFFYRLVLLKHGVLKTIKNSEKEYLVSAQQAGDSGCESQLRKLFRHFDTLVIWKYIMSHILGVILYVSLFKFEFKINKEICILERVCWITMFICMNVWCFWAYIQDTSDTKFWARIRVLTNFFAVDCIIYS